MTITTILIVLALISTYFYKTSKSKPKLYINSFIFAVIFTALSFLSVIEYLNQGTEYDQFVTNRQRMVDRGDDSPENVKYYNDILKSNQEKNKSWFSGNYVDDRYDTLSEL